MQGCRAIGRSFSVIFLCPVKSFTMASISLLIGCVFCCGLLPCHCSYMPAENVGGYSSGGFHVALFTFRVLRRWRVCLVGRVLPLGSYCPSCRLLSALSWAEYAFWLHHVRPFRYFVHIYKALAVSFSSAGDSFGCREVASFSDAGCSHNPLLPWRWLATCFSCFSNNQIKPKLFLKFKLYLIRSLRIVRGCSLHDTFQFCTDGGPLAAQMLRARLMSHIGL